MYDCLPLDLLPDPIDTSPSPEALAIQHQLRAKLAALFYQLFSGRDATILLELYLDGHTALELSATWALTEHQIDYIRRKALRKLRTSPEIVALLRPTATR